MNIEYGSLNLRVDCNIERALPGDRPSEARAQEENEHSQSSMGNIAPSKDETRGIDERPQNEERNRQVNDERMEQGHLGDSTRARERAQRSKIRRAAGSFLANDHPETRV